MSTQAIEHQGRVSVISGSHVEVEIQTSSACAHCSATDRCISADSKTRIITVEDYNGPKLNKGDMVSLKGESKNGLTAVFFAYFLPFLLIIATLFTVNGFMKDEALAGLASLAILIPYYSIIWFFRNRFKKHFSFKINF